MKPRVAVAGAGAFGKHHLRVIHQSPHAELAGVLDLDLSRAAKVGEPFAARVFHSLDELAAHADAAVVATPTVTHAGIGCALMARGLDVLIEKPIAHSPEAGRALVEAAWKHGRVLQVGHLERFNPVVLALGKVITKPLFFEIHRMSEFSPRSLDVDVVLDLMIHDLDVVLSLTGETPEEIRAAGVRILSEKVDIANVRLQFPSGCVANLTASRVSTERVRKLRLFQPHEYISVDYGRQDGVRFRVRPGAAVTDASSSHAGSYAGSHAGPLPAGIDFTQLSVTKDEPLRLELENFFECIATRDAPRVTGEQAVAALEAACAILDRIEVHAQLVARALGTA